MKAILAVRLGDLGCTCYINSVILAQIWSCTMNQIFNIIIWRIWEKPFLNMLVEHVGAVVDLCVNRFWGCPNVGLNRLPKSANVSRTHRVVAKGVLKGPG